MALRPWVSSLSREDRAIAAGDSLADAVELQLSGLSGAAFYQVFRTEVAGLDIILLEKRDHDAGRGLTRNSTPFADDKGVSVRMYEGDKPGCVTRLPASIVDVGIKHKIFLRVHGILTGHDLRQAVFVDHNDGIGRILPHRVDALVHVLEVGLHADAADLLGRGFVPHVKDDLWVIAI